MKYEMAESLDINEQEMNFATYLTLSCMMLKNGQKWFIVDLLKKRFH